MACSKVSSFRRGSCGSSLSNHSACHVGQGLRAVTPHRHFAATTAGKQAVCVPAMAQQCVQEQLALADRLFPVGCRITASGLRLSYSLSNLPAPVLHIAAPVAAPRRRCQLKHSMALRHAPGPLPPSTPRQLCNVANAANTCAPRSEIATGTRSWLFLIKSLRQVGLRAARSALAFFPSGAARPYSLRHSAPRPTHAQPVALATPVERPCLRRHRGADTHRAPLRRRVSTCLLYTSPSPRD